MIFPSALTHLDRLRRFVRGEELHHSELPLELEKAVDAVESALVSRLTRDEANELLSQPDVTPEMVERSRKIAERFSTAE